jgi:hypothetical protein
MTMDTGVRNIYTRRDYGGEDGHGDKASEGAVIKEGAREAMYETEHEGNRSRHTNIRAQPS